MRLSGMWGALLALVVSLWSGMAFAAPDDKPAAEDKSGKPNAVEMVFRQKHLENLEPGKEIVYKFNRTVSNPQLLGQPFSDDITLKIKSEKPDGGRDVDLQIYTGDRARDLQQMPDRLHNPVLLVYFNQSVSSFSMLAGAKTPYLTRLFSTAFKDKANVEPIKVDYKGKQVDAYRITMAPYKGDPNEAKMQGWENAKYALILSDQVPGQIVDLVGMYDNKYTPNMQLTERITLDGVSGLEDAK